MNFNKICKKANKELKKYRKKTNDIVLTPFKDNTKNGKRRRRLDFKTALVILENVLER